MSGLLLDLLGSGLSSGSFKKIGRTSKRGEEWAGPCPVCGGDDRFRVWPAMEGGEAARQAGVAGRWWCRHCDRRGDAIELLVFARGLSFVEACRELHIELAGGPRKPRPLRPPQKEPPWAPHTWEVPSEKWRNQASKLALEAAEYILGYDGALKYLAGRGLPPEAVKAYGLGYLTGDDKTGKGRYRPRSCFGLPDEPSGDRIKKTIWIPRGLTIPQWVADQATGGQTVHRVRFRRRAEDLNEKTSKYMMLTGSGQSPMTLPPTTVAPDRAVWVVVEAELDAMAVHFACGGRVGVMAALTNRGKPDAAAHALLSRCPRILVALDFDQPNDQGQRPGADGYAWWAKVYGQAKRWPVPLGKDPGEAAALGVDFMAWINSALPRPRAAPSPEPSGRPGSEETRAAATTAGAKPDRPCRHDLATFRYLLGDVQWVADRINPICYQDNPDGTIVSFKDQCRICPSRPHGLDDLVRKCKNVDAKN